MEVDHDTGNLVDFIRRIPLLGGGMCAFTGHNYIASQVEVVPPSLLKIVIDWLFEIVLDISYLTDVSPRETGQQSRIKISFIDIFIFLVWCETKSFLQVMARDISEFGSLCSPLLVVKHRREGADEGHKDEAPPQLPEAAFVCYSTKLSDSGFPLSPSPSDDFGLGCFQFLFKSLYTHLVCVWIQPVSEGANLMHDSSLKTGSVCNSCLLVFFASFLRYRKLNPSPSLILLVAPLACLPRFVVRIR